MNPRILIVGAGIAGLALKHNLSRNGVDADIVERSAAPRTSGTGLYLPGNAVRALHDLGLGTELEKEAAPVLRQEIRDSDGTILTAFELSDLWGAVGDCRAIRRNALHEILLTAVGRSRVRFGTGLDAVREDGTAIFSDGDSGRYDLIVGADGIDSAVRPSSITPRFLGQVSWRFVVRSEAVAPGTWTARLGSRGRTFLTLPLGDGEVYCFAAIDSRVPEGPAGDWRFLFGGFGEVAGELLDAADDSYFSPLYEIPGDDWIAPGRVLIGDAAHACSPSMAQGGAMALEDALVLGSLLARDGDVPAVLEAYRERRSARIRFVLEQNHRRDRARNLPAPVRATVFRRFGLRIIRANHAALMDRP
ncbi:FAD-dependent monooxygenase [Actinoplanes sp. OR16]|uniref:FAD-dependent monooxygenase n=1 Tax=Actinoplanes sp. OR16 TaxID=946334 RepID=UPI00135F19F4|nr:FAD-dependent monooxygenase [Actinoplanes sp. OR16]